MNSFTAVVKPNHWDDQHRQLYYGFKDKDNFDLINDLLKYLDAKNDPKLNRLPQDMIDKTIEVLKFILEEERENDIDIAIGQAKALGALP